MLSNITNIFTNQLTIPGVTTTIALVNTGSGGAFGGGILSAGSHTIWLIFVGLMVVWVALSIYGAYKLISGAGDPGETEKGMSIIKNMWFGILAFFVFAMILSVMGAFMGFGNISEWSDNLAQCGPDMDFYFVEVENQIIKLEQDPLRLTGTYNVYCCQEEVAGAVWQGNVYDSGWVVLHPNDFDHYAIQTSPHCNLDKTIEIK